MNAAIRGEFRNIVAITRRSVDEQPGCDPGGGFAKYQSQPQISLGVRKFAISVGFDYQLEWMVMHNGGDLTKLGPGIRPVCSPCKEEARAARSSPRHRRARARYVPTKTRY